MYIINFGILNFMFSFKLGKCFSITYFLSNISTIANNRNDICK